MDLKWPEMPPKVNFSTSKMADQSEMARNAIESDFGHPKWPTSAILSKI